MKILFLEFKTPTHWESCQHILSNLKQSYKKAFPNNFKILSLSLDENEWDQHLSHIKEYAPAIIVFADHRLRIPFWITKIKHIFPLKNISWGVHVYGCFTGRVDEWIALEKIIEKDKIVFISGTHAHEKIVTKFFIDSSNSKTFCFPFNETESLVNDDERKKIRRQYNINEDDIIFIYAGRISYQKNVHHLLNLFSNYAVKNPNLKLFVCGAPDDKNLRTIPYSYYTNYAGSLFFQALEKSNSVTYLGELEHTKLQDFYQACDYVISLSTFYGEDYGRSLIEGLSKGLGCIATNWGGHRDLSNLPQTQLIDVHLQEESLSLDIEKLDQFFLQISKPDRKKNVIQFTNIKAQDQSEILKDIYQNMLPFGGVSKAAFIFQIKDNQAWKDKEFFELHEKILRPYWE